MTIDGKEAVIACAANADRLPSRTARFAAGLPQCSAALCLLLAAAATAAVAQHDPAQHQHQATTAAKPVPTPPVPLPDKRTAVDFPPQLKEHELANMRDHLATLAGIQDFLSRNEFDKAGELAEQRLGMSSFGLHGAHEVAPYMPRGMQDLGGSMHRAASRFAAAAQEASIDRDLAKAIGALNGVTQACVACHAAYRLK